MSQLLQLFAQIGPGRLKSAYLFNGVDQYVIIPDWIPLGMPWSVDARFAVVSSTGADQVLWRSGGASPHQTISADLSGLEANYDNTDGGNTSVGVEAPIALNFASVSSFSASPSGGHNEYNGIIAENTAVPLSITATPVNSLAASGTAAKFLHGMFDYVIFTDDSTIQDTWTTQSDGVRVVNTDADVVVPVQDLFEAFVSVIWGADPLTGFVDVVGHDTLSSALRIYGSTHATFPDQIGIIDTAGNEFRFQNGQVAEGQHVRIRLFNNATGLLTLQIDGANLLQVAAPVSFTDLMLNLWGGSAIAPLPAGWTVGQVAIQNNSNGETYVYLLGAETGAAVPNVGNTGTDFDASWTDTGGKVFIPDNSRSYQFNEGTGATIVDHVGGHDGTIQNFVEDDWVVNNLRMNDSQIAPNYFTQGLPVDNTQALGDDTLAVDSVSAIDHYHQGLPFTAAGRIAISINETVDRFNDGAMPLDAAGRVAITTDPVSGYLASVPYSFSGAVVADAVIVTIPWTDDFVDPNGTLVRNHAPTTPLEGFYTDLGSAMDIVNGWAEATGGVGGSPNFYGAQLQPSALVTTTDYDIAFKIQTGSATAYVNGFGIWSNDDGSVRMQVGYQGTARAMAYTEYDNDTGTVFLGDVINPGGASGVEFDMVIEVRGNNATLKVGGFTDLPIVRSAGQTGHRLSIHLRNSNGGPGITNINITPV